MVIVEIDGKKWYEDKKVKKNLDIYLDAMQQNDDIVIVVDGPERSGKSQRIRQIGKYCADYLGTKFSDANIHQDLNEYIKFSIESPQYTVCILDESRSMLNKKSSMTKESKRFTNFLSECGKYNQIHIIALPAFHDLNNYIVLWRMKFLIHITKWFEESNTTKSGFKLARGKFKLYMNDNYLKKSYQYPYSYPLKWEASGGFYNVEVLNEEELKRYEDKKDLNIEERYHPKYEEERLTKTEEKWRSRWIGLSNAMKYNRSITNGEIADASKMETKTVSNTLSQAQRQN